VNPISEAVKDLVRALKTVPGVGGSVYTDPAAPNIQCPAAVIGPPTLILDGVEVTEAHFPIWVVVDQSERAMEQLWELAPAAVAAIDEHTEGVVSQPPGPFPFPNGATDLPSYLLIAEVPV
jgi:hypothetical protein